MPDVKGVILFGSPTFAIPLFGRTNTKPIMMRNGKMEKWKNV